MTASRSWLTTRNEHYGDPESMEILFVPEVPTQDELNRTWPATPDRMHLCVYGHRTHADAIRYTDPDAMVAVPNLQRLFQQEQRTTGQVNVIHRSPSSGQHPLHRFPYTVESPVFQVTGQVRFRPLQPLDLERTVADITQDNRPANIADEPVVFGYPYDSDYKGLEKVDFPTRPSKSGS